MNKRLKKSIIKTLAYFQYFSHPLTKEELFRFLYEPPKISYPDFLKELEELDENIECKQGMYYLKGNEEIITKRKDKTVDNDRKLAIAIRAVKKIRYIPFLRAVFLCNNTSFEMADSDSDIDVVIITKHKRIWLTRLFATFVLSVYRLRRTKYITTNRICLSFYTTDNNLNLKGLKITEPDIGFMYWITQFVAIYDPDNLYKKMIESNNWIDHFLPNAVKVNNYSDACVSNNKVSKIVKGFWQTVWSTIVGDMIENQAREIQKIKMRRNIHSVQDKLDTRVVINDDVLKFHENDRRKKYQESWQKTYRQYI